MTHQAAGGLWAPGSAIDGRKNLLLVDWVGWFEPACQGAWLSILLMFARIRQGMVVKFCFPNFFPYCVFFFFLFLGFPPTLPPSRLTGSNQSAS